MGNQLRGGFGGWGEIPTLRFYHQQLRLKKQYHCAKTKKKQVKMMYKMYTEYTVFVCYYINKKNAKLTSSVPET